MDSRSYQRRWRNHEHAAGARGFEAAMILLALAVLVLLSQGVGLLP